MRIEETILINELNRRNREVLKALYAEYFPILVRYAEGFVFDRAVCEDLVQGLFLHIWENLGSIRFRSSIKSYLYCSVRHRCMNHLRALRVTDKHNVMYVEALLNTHDGDLWSDPGTEGEIREAIENLPGRMALIFRMKYLQEKKIAEIARELEVSENTVKTQLLRGRKRLRRHLARFIRPILLF